MRVLCGLLHRLLADQFHLTVHREKRETRVYSEQLG